MLTTAQLHHALALLSLRLLLLLAASVVLQIVFSWVAAKLVAPLQASLGNALRWYGYGLLASLGATVVFVGLLLVSAMLGIHGALLLLLLWVAALIYFAFVIPMRLFEVGPARALLMMALVWLGGVGASYGLGLVLGMRASPDEVEQLIRQAEPDAAAVAAHPEKLLKAAQPAAAATPAARPAAKLVTLTRAVRVPVVLDGKVKGDVELERGQKLPLVGVNGAKVLVKYLGSVTSIPRDATDL